MAKKIGVLRFPGTNCDRDVWSAVENLGFTPEWLWHENRFAAGEYHALIVPGGFSYGDYLRCGALAARSQVMESTRQAAQKGVPILGICNGFQILTEAGLLPGALLRNESRRFVDKWVTLKFLNPTKWWSKDLSDLRLPVAHGEGRFYAGEGDLARLFDKGQVWCTYFENPNGSVRDIAGVMNETRNIAALMPHPERAVHDWMGGEDGRTLLSALMGGFRV